MEQHVGVITNKSPYDWTGHNLGYFVTAGMTDISTIIDSKLIKISFQPPKQADTWHGYVYHLFFLNGKFKVWTKIIQDNRNRKEIVIDFQYPAQCDGIKKFEDGIIHAYTICSHVDRAFTASEIRKLIENRQAQQKCQN